MRLHRHKCTHVGKRFEHRSMCTTPVVRRCNRSIRCQNCPIRWGSRRRWFHLLCFEKFLPSTLGTLRCHRHQIYRPGKSLRLLGRIGNTLLALECISSHWMPVGRNRRHNLCKLWYQQRPRTCRVHIQYTKLILDWLHTTQDHKWFGWRIHRWNNYLLHIHVLHRSNCRIQEEHHCMPWNLWLCCQIHWGIQGTWCCRKDVDMTQCHNRDT